MSTGKEAVPGSGPIDLSTTSPNQILASEQRRRATRDFENSHRKLMQETANLDLDGALAEQRELLMDFDSLRTLSNHELVTSFFRSFRDTFTGDPYDESVPEDEWYKHDRECQARRERFGGSLKADIFPNPLWGSEEAFLGVVQPLHVVRMYGENEEGLTRPYPVPVWAIGRETKDDGEVEYLAASLSTVLSPNDDPRRKNRDQLAVDYGSADGSLARAHEALDEIQYTREYRPERLFREVDGAFEVFSFYGPSELPELGKQLTVEDLENISGREDDDSIRYDIRPRVIAEQIDDETIPITNEVSGAVLTDDVMWRMDVLGRLKKFAESRGIVSGLDNLLKTFTEKRHTREQIYQASMFEELEHSPIPPDFEIPPEWREEHPR